MPCRLCVHTVPRTRVYTQQVFMPAHSTHPCTFAHTTNTSHMCACTHSAHMHMVPRVCRAHTCMWCMCTHHAAIHTTHTCAHTAHVQSNTRHKGLHTCTHTTTHTSIHMHTLARTHTCHSMVTPWGPRHNAPPPTPTREAAWEPPQAGAGAAGPSPSSSVSPAQGIQNKIPSQPPARVGSWCVAGFRTQEQQTARSLLAPGLWPPPTGSTPPPPRRGGPGAPVPRDGLPGKDPQRPDWRGHVGCRQSAPGGRPGFRAPGSRGGPGLGGGESAPAWCWRGAEEPWEEAVKPSASPAGLCACFCWNRPADWAPGGGLRPRDPGPSVA